MATEPPFTSGDGEIVRGTTLALVMAMTGRATYLDELTGAGIEVFRGRV